VKPSTKKAAPMVLLPAETTKPLSTSEKLRLEKLKDQIKEGKKAVNEGFRKMALAFHQIKEEKLYRAEGTFAAFFMKEFGFKRAHAYRIANAGEWITKFTMSPHGDIVNQFDTESHFRALLAINDDAKQEAVLDLLEHWTKLQHIREGISSRLVEAALTFLDPPKPPPVGQETSNKTAQELLKLIDQIPNQLPRETAHEVKEVLKKLKKDAHNLVKPRTTEIGWTQRTWNPLEGCSFASEGCRFCYAAKFIATRARGNYPGLAKRNEDGTYAFTGKIVLEAERLAIPLSIKTPTVFFVNSMSDLFHEKVPFEFIDQVFDVMEKASWHTFQVLTKRPEIMAKYTQKRYKSHAEAPRNVWMGTSTENQDAYDKRIPFLRKVLARVRWLSCEPLIGPLKLGNATGIDWVVVGGESQSGRRMNADWARSLRDECKKNHIRFFFKQWGDFGQDGKRHKNEKPTPEERAMGLKKGRAKLDGDIIEEFPMAR